MQAAMLLQRLSDSLGVAARRVVRPAALVCVFAGGSVCFGGLATCLNTPATSGVRSNQVAGVAIAAEGPGDDFNTMDSTTPAGCAGTDIQFLNLTIDSAASSPVGTYMSTLANQSLLTGPVAVVFSSVRGLDNGAKNGNDDGVNEWTNSATSPGPTPITTSYEVDSTVAMYSFTLNLLGVQLGTRGGTLSGEFDLCLGAAFVGGFGGTCAGTAETFTLSPGIYTYNEILTGGYTTVGVANNFLLRGTGTGAGVTFLTSFDESFDSPEPSTFALLGSALAGLVAFRLRKYKQA
jgi:hypothetical protein